MALACHQRASVPARHTPFSGSKVWRSCGPSLRSRTPTVVNSAAPTDEPATATDSSTTAKKNELDKELMKFTRQTAATFAPRSSVAVKNPAYRGSALYWVFEGQAWVFAAIGGLLSFNILFPTDDPSIPRLLGMWSIWMMTVPSLRAKECMPNEKEALNVLFLLIPLLNVALPFVWKSFGFIYTADVIALAGVYTWKGVWQEVYIPILNGAMPASTLQADALKAQAAATQAAAESPDGDKSS